MTGSLNRVLPAADRPGVTQRALPRPALPRPALPRLPGQCLTAIGTIALTASASLLVGSPVGAALSPGPTTTMTAMTAGSVISSANLVLPPAPVTGIVPTKTMVARALVRKVNVYATPGAKKASIVMDNRTNFSGAHVFVVIAKQGGWLQVLVPERPNGRTGWVRMSDVGVYQHDYAIVVTLSTHQLTLFQNGVAVMQETVAIGQAKYPTPLGMSFIRELARPGNPWGAYGPYAFGLSAFSNVLTRFGAGNGQVGIHGTNAPNQLGTNASHGCIRLRNEAITALAKRLPQGVPVDVRA